MAIGFHRSLHALMPQPFRDQRPGEAHLHPQTGAEMPDAIDANPLYAGAFAAVFHLMGAVGLCVREQPVELEALALSDVVFHEEGVSRVSSDPHRKVRLIAAMAPPQSPTLVRRFRMRGA